MPVVLDRWSKDYGDDWLWIEPYGEENLARVKSAVEERDGIGKKLFADRLKAYRDGGCVGIMSMGLPKSEVVFPRRVEHFAQEMVLKKGKALPDFLDIGYQKGGVMVSRRMQAVIEQHEAPGAGFQFHPATIVSPDGSMISEDYVYWDVFRRVDAIDPDGEVGTVAHEADLSLGNHRWSQIVLQSEQQLEEGPQKRWVFKSAIGDAAVWSDFRYGHPLGMPIWVSDALWADLNSAGLTGFKPASTWGEI